MWTPSTEPETGLDDSEILTATAWPRLASRCEILHDVMLKMT
jgi:hypothetical protein